MIGVVSVSFEPNEAGLYEPIVTHNTAATAPGEPTAVVESPAHLPCESADENVSAIYTLMQEEDAVTASVCEANLDAVTTGLPLDQINTVEGTEAISIPILSSTLTGSPTYDDNTTRIFLVRTEDGETIGLKETDIWIQTEEDVEIDATDPSDITHKAFIASALSHDEMGTDMVTNVSSDTPELALSYADHPCVDKNDDYGQDDDGLGEEEINIVEVVDNDHEQYDDARPDSTMTVGSESSSAVSSSDSLSSSYRRRSDVTMVNDNINNDGYDSGEEEENGIIGNKSSPNRTAIGSDSFMPIRIPPPITRTPLPNLPGIKGTSLAASLPVYKSKRLRSTPPRRGGAASPVSSLENGSGGNSGPISHSVSSMLLKGNGSSNDSTPIRPIVRPYFGAFGLNHQLFSSGFHFPPPTPPNVHHLPLPPLTVFATPLRVVHPSFPLPHHPGITPLPPLCTTGTGCSSTIGLRGTLPGGGNLPSHVRVIPPPFATGPLPRHHNHQPETRRIVRRRRNSATNSKSGDSGEDNPSQKVRRRQANARERDRVTYLNSGFEQLRRVLPWVQQGRRISKVDTLRAAIAYIDHLQRILWDADHANYLNSTMGKYDLGYRFT